MWDWDEEKRRANRQKHGVDLADVARFDWDAAMVFPDARHDYGEVRQRVLGMIDGRLHVLVLTLREDRIRVISLRKANNREVRIWAKPGN